MAKKLKIEVLQPGGLPGKTSGDVIDDPTAQEIDQARGNPTCLRIISESGTAGEEEIGEVGRNADLSGKASHHR